MGNVSCSSASDISLARVVRSYVSNSEELPLFSNVEFDIALSFFAFKDNLNKTILHQEHKVKLKVSFELNK